MINFWSSKTYSLRSYQKSNPPFRIRLQRVLQIWQNDWYSFLMMTAERFQMGWQLWRLFVFGNLDWCLLGNYCNSKCKRKKSSWCWKPRQRNRTSSNWFHLCRFLRHSLQLHNFHKAADGRVQHLLDFYVQVPFFFPKTFSRKYYPISKKRYSCQKEREMNDEKQRRPQFSLFFK